jgi:hypothetical protein
MKDIIGLAVLAWPLTLLILIGLTFLVVVPMVVAIGGFVNSDSLLSGSLAQPKP